MVKSVPPGPGRDPSSRVGHRPESDRDHQLLPSAEATRSNVGRVGATGCSMALAAASQEAKTISSISSAVRPRRSRKRRSRPSAGDADSHFWGGERASAPPGERVGWVPPGGRNKASGPSRAPQPPGRYRSSFGERHQRGEGSSDTPEGSSDTPDVDMSLTAHTTSPAPAPSREVVCTFTTELRTVCYRGAPDFSGSRVDCCGD